MTMKKLCIWFVRLSSLISAERTACAQGYAPNEATRHMQVADGFEVQLVASEPHVRQPVCIEFDDRGRFSVGRSRRGSG
jgi:hypothetical protein